MTIRLTIIALAALLAWGAQAFETNKIEEAEVAAMALAASDSSPVTLRPGAPLRAALKGAGMEAASARATETQVVHLRFENLTAEAADQPTAHVYLGDPTEGVGDRKDDPHYLGSVSFFPVPMTEPVTVALPLKRALAASRATGMEADAVEVVTVTLETADGAEEGVSVDLTEAELKPAP